MDVTPSGRSSLQIPVHLWKAFAPILRRLFESDIDVMPEQAENASAPISLRLAESVSDVMPGQP